MELHYISLLGLLLIGAGWLMQYFALRAGKKNVMKNFVLVYSLGVLFLVIDGFLGGLYDLALMNVATLACGLLVFFALKK